LRIILIGIIKEDSFSFKRNFDVNSKYFVNINAIKADETKDQFFIIYTNTLPKYNNLNNYKNIEITQLDDEMKNNSKNDNNIKISNSNETSNANNTKNKNTNDTNVITHV
jgi:hypothetical protein